MNPDTLELMQRVQTGHTTCIRAVEILEDREEKRIAAELIKIETPEFASDLVKKILRNFTDDEKRLNFIGEITADYCLECGRLDPNHRCQCWNDE